MKLKGKAIGMLVGPGYEDLEFWVPLMRMIEEGAEVKVIATKGGETYSSKSVHTQPKLLGDIRGWYHFRPSGHAGTRLVRSMTRESAFCSRKRSF